MPVAGSAVLSENGRRRTSPEKSPVRTWTNWPAREPVARLGRVVRLEPLARQDLPTLDQLRRGEPHRHAVGLVLARRRRRPSASASSSSARPAPRRPSPPPPSPFGRVAGQLRRDRRERLGERVGQVAEDVGRVVELDELLGAARASATRPRRPRG